MLVGLKPNIEYQESIRLKSLELSKKHPDMDFTFVPQSDPRYVVEPGVYISTFPFNFYHNLAQFLDVAKEYDNRWNCCVDPNKSTYGVADNVEQIKAFYKEEVEHPENRYVIGLSYVFQEKSNAGKGGGWRWHKWGPYIGELKPEYEYLDDEDFGPDFAGYVIVFDIIKVN